MATAINKQSSEQTDSQGKNSFRNQMELLGFI